MSARQTVSTVLYAMASVGLIGFATVQWNDPDALLWIALYGIAALWAALAAWRPRWFTRPGWRLASTLSAVVYVLLTILYWPDVDHWWRASVWWEAETAREGMGVMIATAVVVIVAVASSGTTRVRGRSVDGP